jgi:hypothetical protein
MFIVWGKYAKKEVVGIVADHCPQCDSVQEFALTDHFTAGHIYFIKVSGWSWVATSRVCARCKSELPARVRDYDSHLPATMSRVPLLELVRATNPQLLGDYEVDQRRSRRKPDEDVLDVEPVAARAADPELEQLQQRVADFEPNDIDVLKLKEKLKAWSRLSASERQQARELLDRSSKRHALLGKAKEFLFSAQQAYANKFKLFGCLGSLLLYIALLVSMYWIPISWTWYWIALYVVVWGIVLLVAAGLLIGFGTRHWCKHTLVPLAEENGIPLDILLSAFRRLETWSDEDKAKISNLFDDRADIIQTLETHVKAAGDGRSRSPLPG